MSADARLALAQDLRYFRHVELPLRQKVQQPEAAGFPNGA
jgi:hypothetical protein